MRASGSTQIPFIGEIYDEAAVTYPVARYGVSSARTGTTNSFSRAKFTAAITSEMPVQRVIKADAGRSCR